MAYYAVYLSVAFEFEMGLIYTPVRLLTNCVTEAVLLALICSAITAIPVFALNRFYNYRFQFLFCQFIVGFCIVHCYWTNLLGFDEFTRTWKLT